MSFEEVLDKYVILPEKPNLEERRKGIRDFVENFGLNEVNAAILYEYNQCEPLILPRREDGTCVYLDKSTGLSWDIYLQTFTGDFIFAIWEMNYQRFRKW